MLKNIIKITVILLLSAGGFSCMSLKKTLPDYSLSLGQTEGTIPFLVRLEEDKTNRFFCSGSVISDNYVLTAAHCVADKIDEKVIVRSIPNENGETISLTGTVVGADESAGYALVLGDFKQFVKARIVTDSAFLLMLTGPLITCGFPRGENVVCYPTDNRPQGYYGSLSLRGYLFPGMSGGPVIDKGIGAIVAVNTATAENSLIVISPLVGLFKELGVKETP